MEENSNRSNLGLKLKFMIFLFLMLILFLALGILTLLLDFLGVIDITKGLPELWKKNKYVQIYLEKSKIIRMSKEERIKYGIEKERRLLQERKKMIENQFKKFKRFQYNLDEKDRKLKEKELSLQKKEKEINKHLSDVLAEIKLLNNRDLRMKKMAKVLEKIEPLQAAQILQNQSPDVIVELFLKIRENKLAPIFEALSPEKAQKVVNLILNYKLNKLERILTSKKANPPSPTNQHKK